MASFFFFLETFFRISAVIVLHSPAVTWKHQETTSNLWREAKFLLSESLQLLPSYLDWQRHCRNLTAEVDEQLKTQPT